MKRRNKRLLGFLVTSALTFLPVLENQILFAQEKFTLNGLVINKQGSPINRAHIQITFENGSETAITDENGFFIVEIVKGINEVEIQTTHVSFERKTIKFRLSDDKELVEIILKDFTSDLPPIVITGTPIKADSLVKEAIVRIPDNYITDIHFKRGFVRSDLFRGSEVVRQLEMSADYRLNGYGKKEDYRRYRDTFFSSFDDTQGGLAITPYRDGGVSEKDTSWVIGLTFPTSDESDRGYFIPGEPLAITATDEVRYGRYILDLDKYNRYTYDYIGDKEGCFVIKFKPKRVTKRIFLQGEIHLDETSLAVKFLHFEELLNDDKSNHYSAQLEYGRENDKWALKRIIRQENTSRLYDVDYNMLQELILLKGTFDLIKESVHIEVTNSKTVELHAEPSFGERIVSEVKEAFEDEIEEREIKE